MDTTAIGERAYRLRWWTLVVIAISVLIVVIDSSIVNIALPTLQRELGTSMAELQWIINSYIMSFAVLMLLMGSLGDRYGRARMLQAGILAFGGASLGAALAGSGTQLIVWRAIMGIGAAMILPTTLAIITNVFPREERGKAIGAWAAMNAIGVALGPIVGGLIVDSLDWNWIFLINLPIAAVALTAGWSLIPDSRDLHARKADYPGTVLSCLALAALVFGLIQGDGWGWTHSAVVGSLAASVLLTAAFVLWERHTRHPMLEVGFFRSARFSAGLAGVSLTGLGMIGVVFGLTLYMQLVNGYTALETGIRFLPLALGMFMGAGSADILDKRFGTKSVMALGFGGLVTVLALTSLWQVDTPYWQIGSLFFGFGFFLGYIVAPATDAVMGALPEAKAGVGSAMNAVSRLVAGSIGVASLVAALNGVYSSSFRDSASTIAGLPQELVEAASDSVGTALAIAEQLPPEAGAAVAQAARQSFMDGWHAMAYAIIVISAFGALVVLRYMPQKHGSVPGSADSASGD